MIWNITRYKSFVQWPTLDQSIKGGGTVSHHPYLVVELSSNLNWSFHIENIIGKAYRSLGFIRRNVYSCPKNVKSQAYLTGQAPEYLTSQFITREQVSERTTRSSQKLNIPLFRTASGQRTFYYRTFKLWNNLESFLKLSPSVEIFKRSLRSQLLDNFVNTS